MRELETSTRPDLEWGKRLEYEALAGAVVRAARRHHLQVPAMEAVYALLALLNDTGRVAPRLSGDPTPQARRRGDLPYLFSNCLFPNRLFHDS